MNETLTDLEKMLLQMNMTQSPTQIIAMRMAYHNACIEREMMLRKKKLPSKDVMLLGGEWKRVE